MIVVRVWCAGLALLAVTLSDAQAATGGKVDEKYLIPVPTVQRKIEVGTAKGFEDDAFSVAVIAVERTSVEVAVNGGAPFRVEASTQTFVPLGPDRICTMVYLGMSGKKAILSARCDPADDNLRALLDAQQHAVARVITDPAALIETAEKGSLKNPYLGNAEAIAEGQQLFLGNSCNGCHGGNGGGGMGPALSNGVWVYGNADDTLFRLVTLGSEGLQEKGFTRIAREKVVGPMPSYTGIIEDADHLWKILAFVRSVSLTDAPPVQ